MTQKEYISKLCEKYKDAVIIGSIGTISYDLKDIDHPNKILIKGAMGSALACGIGYALSTDKKVVVIIGDGALLMHLGSIATYLKHKPQNLEVHVMQNDCYQSCGGQSNNFQFIKSMLPKEFNVHILPKD